MAAEPEVTEEQAEEALRALQQTEEPPQEETPEQPVLESSAEAEPGEQVAEEVAEDDLESLQKRLEERESAMAAAEERYRAQLEALNQRNTESERILRDKFLRKSTVADKAMKALEAARSPDGISEEDVDRAIRDIRGSMNPESPSYAPQPTQPVATEDQTLALHSFLNEKGMTQQEADQFGSWVREKASGVMSPTEQAVAGESLGAFLRLAHVRYLEEQNKTNQRSDAVDAVRTVQRAQKAAAQAASGSPRAPSKPRAAKPQEVDVSKLTPEDISDLMRQSVTAYK